MTDSPFPTTRSSPLRVQNFVDFFADHTPLELAEDWDNVGLLLGDADAPVDKVLTCLTLTPDVAAEAIREGAALIVSHHPILFRPVQRLTTTDTQGAMLLDLIRGGVAVYSPHTAFDSAGEGINQQLAQRLDLQDIQPIRPDEAVPGLGSGRYGTLSATVTLESLVARIRAELQAPQVSFVGLPDSPVQSVAVACGAAAEFLRDAHAAGCDVLLTGEARFHSCLEARSLGMGLIIAGHYQTERFAVEQLADLLSRQFQLNACWASLSERDPVSWA
ncbi:MAG: Nif3-like dinuclear metal center hexameric protein [Planctomycetaceae bacterium]|nr:Nif3-like dinuclear metal center hexameric protein [Planctomycetaceae bacterium]